MNDEKRNYPRCIAYAAGPGDIVKTFSYWQQGLDDPNQMSVTYSGLFFDACRSLGVRGVAISSCARVDRVRTEQYHVENLPKGKVGNPLAFHFQQIMYVRKVVRKAITEGADMLVMSDATGYFFALSLFAPRGMGIVPTLHCNLWSRFRPLSPVQNIINRLNAAVFASRADASLAVSPSIIDQIAAMTGGRHKPVHRFHQLYRPSYFRKIAPPDLSRDRFNLLFVGRLETEKGVYDLLRMAELMRERGQDRVVIHLCGTGSEEAALRDAVAAKKLQHRLIVHGFCRQQELIGHINASHACIVPTRSTFEEGYNKALVESLLSGRPVITSTVCVYPHLEKISDGIIVVPPDDVEGYLSETEKLASEMGYYLRKQSAAMEGMEVFYDEHASWKAVLERIVKEYGNG
jgi:glycogen synthase